MDLIKTYYIFFFNFSNNRKVFLKISSSYTCTHMHACMYALSHTHARIHTYIPTHIILFLLHHGLYS